MTIVGRSRSFALVADHFHPANLPPEAKINTEVAKQLLNRGDRVDLFCTQGAELPKALAGVTLYPQPSSWNRRGVLQLTELLAGGDYDEVVLMYDANGFGLSAWVTLIPLWLRKRYQIRARITAHFTSATLSPLPARLGRALRGLNRLGLLLIDGCIGGLCCADHLVFYCEEHRSTLLREQPHLLARSVISPAPLTVDLQPLPTGSAQSLRGDLGFDPNRPLVLFFGLIYPLKGIEFLLHAVKVLNGKTERLQVAIVGEQGGISGDESWRQTCRDYWEAMQCLTRDLGLAEQVRWAGHVDEADLPAWLAAADLACFPFTIGIRANNSSFSVCAAYGLPVVSTDGRNVDAIFREPKNGVRLVPHRRADLLAEALRELLADSQRLREMRTEITNFYQRYFRWDTFVDSLVSR